MAEITDFVPTPRTRCIVDLETGTTQRRTKEERLRELQADELLRRAWQESREKKAA
jgi:hypothetical protein